MLNALRQENASQDRQIAESRNLLCGIITHEGMISQISEYGFVLSSDKPRTVNERVIIFNVQLLLGAHVIFRGRVLGCEPNPGGRHWVWVAFEGETPPELVPYLKFLRASDQLLGNKSIRWQMPASPPKAL